MVYDTDAATLEWHRVEYPIERVQKLMTEVAPRYVDRPERRYL